MALGDADLASGVFFADCGVPVVFGQQSTKGLFDAPGRDAGFGETTVNDVAFKVEILVGSLNPMPRSDQRITVNGKLFGVRNATPMDDGATVSLALEAL